MSINKKNIKFKFIELTNKRILYHLKNKNIKGGNLAKLKNKNKFKIDNFDELLKLKKKFNLNWLINFIIIKEIKLYDRKYKNQIVFFRKIKIKNHLVWLIDE